MFYVLILLSAYLIIRDIKSQKNKKRVLLVYVAILGVSLCYNIGSFVGEQMYLLGFNL